VSVRFTVSLLVLLPLELAAAALDPRSFTSLGVFGVQNVNQYFAGQQSMNGVAKPVIVDNAANVLYTGVFIGAFSLGTLQAVFDFDSFTLGANQTLDLRSVPNNNANISALFSSPISILSLTSINITGSILGRGANGSAGGTVPMGQQPPPGIGAGGVGQTGGGDGGNGQDRKNGNGGGGPSPGQGGQNANPAGGGGGGGFGGAGGDGGTGLNGGNGGMGGPAVTTLLSTKLQGGSGGGAGGGGGEGQRNPAYGSGGGAGGAGIELGACCNITISGTIDVRGGNGGPGDLGAGGGGSGGGIFLHANTVTVSGNLRASGGDGGAVGSFGAQGGGGGAGMIVIQTNQGGFNGNGATIELNGGTGANNGAMSTVTFQTVDQQCPEPASIAIVALAAFLGLLVLLRRGCGA
jgi:hypothetical protein